MILPGQTEPKGKTPLDMATDKYDRDPIYRHIAKYLRRAEEAQGDPGPMDEPPWAVHARETRHQTGVVESQARAGDDEVGTEGIVDVTEQESLIENAESATTEPLAVL